MTPEERRREQVGVQWVLRIGLMAGGLSMAVGLLMGLVAGEWSSAAMRPLEILSGGTMPDRIIGAGIFLIALTPVIRVGALITLWLLERDYKFVALGLLVVIILVISALTGSG